MTVQCLPVLGIARVGMVRAAVERPVLKDAGVQRRRRLLVAIIVVVVARVGSRELSSCWLGFTVGERRDGDAPVRPSARAGESPVHRVSHSRSPWCPGCEWQKKSDVSRIRTVRQAGRWESPVPKLEALLNQTVGSLVRARMGGRGAPSLMRKIVSAGPSADPGRQGTETLDEAHGFFSTSGGAGGQWPVQERRCRDVGVPQPVKIPMIRGCAPRPSIAEPSPPFPRRAAL